MARGHAAGFCICLTGTESSGKTTLATELARDLAAPLVPEAARAYLDARHARGEPGYGPDDLLAIARLQEESEVRARAAARARDESWAVVVCDTDLVVIAIWWRERYGSLHPELEAALARRGPRGYLLTRPDMPWEPDPLREHRFAREPLHARYREWLAADRFQFFEITGTRQERLTAALAQVANWRNRS